jgi:hypothetical protein
MARPAVAVTPNTNRALQCEPISRAPALLQESSVSYSAETAITIAGS